MPAVDRLRRYQRRDLYQYLAPQATAFLGQTPALVRIETDAFALGVDVELFAKNTILLDQILNDSLLMTVHPASHHGQQ